MDDQNQTLSQRIQQCSIWKILTVFNIIASVIFIPLFIITNELRLEDSIHAYIHENDKWIALRQWTGIIDEYLLVIIPIIIILFACKYVIRKLAEKEPIEKNVRLNKRGKILFWIGIISIPTIYFIARLIPHSCGSSTEFCISPGSLLAWFFWFLVIPAVLFIATSMWLTSNFGSKNTFRIYGIYIGCMVFQFLAFVGIGYIVFEIFNL